MQHLNLLLRNIFAVIFLVSWIAGVVLAKGTWATFFSIFLPFYAWYLVIEKVMINSGVLT